MSDNLTPLDRSILWFLLVDGACGPKRISESIDAHHVSVSKRLKSLSEEGLVVDKGYSDWTLTIDGVRVIRSLEREGSLSGS